MNTANVSTLPAGAASSERGRSFWSAPFIAGRSYDWLFFVFSPLLALAIAEFVTGWSYAFERTAAFGTENTRIGFFIAVFTSSHLVAVFFRSHANTKIFHQHRWRFTVIPVLAFVAMTQSAWVFVSAFVLAFLWDVYHSAMQNFGLCRIYDAKMGNSGEVGRRLDFWVNHVLYVGPILGGLSLIATFEVFDHFLALGWEQPSHWLRWIEEQRLAIRWAVVAAGSAFLAYYAYAYWRLAKQGYKISAHKVCLLASVGITSVWAWGFLPPVEAFFVANLFHAAQYFAIVWWLEKKNIRQVFGLGSIPGGQWLTLGAFVGLLAGFGMLMEVGINSQYNVVAGESSVRWAASAALLCALLHFWYDGFIWSVRRKEV